MRLLILLAAGCAGTVDPPDPPAAGTTFEPGGWFRVTDDPAEGAKHHATSAFRDDGVFTIAWHNGRVAPTDAWVRSYAFDDRAPLGDAMPVNDPESSGRKVDVHADADGTWITAYEDDGDMVNVTRLGPSLERIRDPVALTTFSVNHSTDVAVSEGGVAAVWQSDKDETSAYVYARLNADSAIDRLTILDQGPSYACPPDISPVAGGWLMVWCIREDTPATPEAPDADIVATVVDFDGDVILAPFKVDDDGLPSPARPMCGVDPVTGALLFTWHSHDPEHVQHGASFRAFHGDGTPLTGEVPLGTPGRSHYPVVEGVDGRAIVVFEEAESDEDPARGDPQIQVFDLNEDGTSVLGPEPFHPLAGVNQWWPSLAVAPVDEGFGVVATWASDADRADEVDVYVGTALLGW